MGAAEITIIVIAALIVVGVTAAAIVRKAKGKGGCSGCGGCTGCPHGSYCSGKHTGTDGYDEKNNRRDGPARSQEK